MKSSGNVSSIRFHYLKNTARLKNTRQLKQWLNRVIVLEKKQTGSVNYIFCDDDYLLELNKKFLNHRTLTDIITFDYCKGSLISGEIYISVERVKENAVIYGSNFATEMCRVMVHGVLHLLGYKDKTPNAKSRMTKKEDFYLNLLQTNK